MNNVNQKFKMTKRIFVYIFILCFFQVSVPVWPEVNIRSDIAERIDKILETPSQVYDLDLKENDIVLNRIDTFFSKYLDFNKAKKKQKKNSNRINYVIQSTKNIPVFTGPEVLEEIKIDKPINIWYIKEPQKRSFMKELRVPSQKVLPKQEIIQLGESFITTNNLCNITDKDQLINPHVISRKRGKLANEKLEQEFVILQRVIFKREFDGLQIINSKQIVDIHPTSREIISYKNILWTPVNEKSGKTMPYVSREKIVEKITSATKEGKANYDVVKIKAGRYLTNDRLLPVLMVYMKRKEPKAGPLSPEITLIIDLVKDAAVIESDRKLLKPTKSVE